MLLVCAGCGTPPPSNTPEPVTPYLITRSEVEASVYENAYDLVRATHANWFNSRGFDSMVGRPTTVKVYVDAQRYGEIDTLWTIPIDQIGEIRYINGNSATARWGLGHGAGVIQVITLIPDGGR